MDLEELLEGRLKKSEFPPFFEFSEPGTKILGQITGRRKLIRDDGKEDLIWEIKKLDGQVYSLPSFTIIQYMFKELDVKEGDYVLIRYDGTAEKAKSGRKPAKLFSVAKATKEEAEQLLQRKKQETVEEKPVTTFLKTLFQFYPEMKLDELQARLDAKKFNVNAIEAIKNLDFLKLDGEVVKKVK